MFIFLQILLYVMISATCATLVRISAKRHFPFDWLGYFVLGLVGGWIGGALFGAVGIVVCGISVAAVALGAACMIELDYRLNCCVDPECEARETRHRSHPVIKKKLESKTAG